MIETFAPALIVLTVLLFAWLWTTRRKPDFKAPETKAFNPAIFYNFSLRPSLFVNQSEQALFAVLYKRLTPQYRVFSKVRLEDIIGVKPHRGDAQTAWSLRGRVKSRHVDFLIVTPQGAPLMIIELDGRSHQSAAAKRPDAFKNGLAKAVGLPLRRVTVGQDFHGFVSKIKTELPWS
jgi:hypothetical protein